MHLAHKIVYVFPLYAPRKEEVVLDRWSWRATLVFTDPLQTLIPEVHEREVPEVRAHNRFEGETRTQGGACVRVLPHLLIRAYF